MTETLSIRIKIGDVEVQVSGSKEDVLNTLESIPGMLRDLSEAISTVAQTTKITIPQTIELTKSENEYPTLSLPPNTSCPEALIELLKTDWGRKAPRTLNEMIQAMKLNALHYPKGTISGRLADMTKKGIVRRVQTESGYGYVLTKP
ncbi:MAG: hypothetical protein QXL67_03680 [Candidatus Bathyarchaeia archaeon]